MILKESFFRDIARLIIWYPYRIIIPRLPFSVFFLSCKLFAFINFVGGYKKRRIISRNLRKVLGGDARILKHTFKYFEMHYIDRLWIFLIPKLNRGNIQELHSTIGIQNLDEALGRGKGCILVHGHMGPTQMPLFELGLRGYRMTQIGYHDEEHLSNIGEKVALHIRKRYEGMIPANIIFGDRFLRPVFYALKNNQVVMTAGDGTGGGRFLGKYHPVSFIGHTLPFPMGPVALSKKTGAPILPAFTIGDSKGRFMTIIEKPIDLKDSGDLKKDSAESIMLFVERLEYYVKKYPGFWHFWNEFFLMVDSLRSSSNHI